MARDEKAGSNVARRRKKNVDWGAVAAGAISALTIGAATVGVVVMLHKKQKKELAAAAYGV